MRVEFQRLAEGEPFLADEAAPGDGAPQDQDIYAAVWTAGGRVARKTERSADAGPGLHPGHASLFELGDDLVGDFLVQAGPVRKGLVGRCRVGHGGSPRRAGESLSLACSARHGSGTALSLSLFRPTRTVGVSRPCQPKPLVLRSFAE